MEVGTSRLSQDVQDRLLDSLYLVVEIFAVDVFDQGPVLMTHVSLPQDAILLFGFICRLIYKLRHLRPIKLFRPIRGRDHVNDGIIAIVPEDFALQPQVVEDGIPL